MSTTEEIQLKVHRCRFYGPELWSINSMTYNEKEEKLAVLRRRVRKFKTGQSDTQSVVQVWNMKSKAPFVEQTIYDNPDNPGLLEALQWLPDGRLFSCGLNACINEYDLKNSSIKSSYNGRSGPIWCMALDATNSLIAVGSEDAMISVYRLFDESLNFEKVLDRSDNRILCIKWHQPEDNTPPLIVSGSIDYIKIWNYQTGRCIDSIQVGTTGVVIWCLVVLKDFTIVSGDSNGTTSFWDGKVCTLNTTYKSHKGDVLAISVDSEESNLYSSGVDPTIVKFSRTKSMKYNSWTMNIKRNLNTHDVRAMICIKTNWLISGGIDTYLTLSCYPPNLKIRHFVNYSQNVTIIKDYALVQYETFVYIWKLGKSDEDVFQTSTLTGECIETLPLAESAVKLANIKSRKPIISSSFNDKFIAYSNYDNLKIKTWNETSVAKVPLLYEPIVNGNHLTFCGQNYLAISSGTTLNVLKLEVLGVVLHKRNDLKNNIYLMSGSNQYLAVSTIDPKRTVTVYSTDDWSLICDFANNLLPTALQINPFSSEGDIWMAYANRKLYNYNINSKSIVKSVDIKNYVKSHAINEANDEDYYSIKSIAFAKNTVIFSDDMFLYKLDIKTNKTNKRSDYRHIIKLGNGDKLNELVMFEVTPLSLFHRLPQTLAKKRFGT
ncbi:U3 small nucleolar RNA-associated protein 4 homolog [Oppia nitens]|uniref:U3 small nucleolar RNA-associated protein 4 homolog n=1 Tax=Oppia nitens TaxID=1686743 RepID=UPI0023DC3E62|nr:U3 small nucleolar RNA-associated protein 4 homolog [Oppia nitens]